MTTATPVAAFVTSRREHTFHLYMALLCALVAFSGFLPTFWFPMARGGYVASPVIAIHGVLFFVWALFFAVQTWLPASGRIGAHRAAGLFGISLASVVTVFGILVAIKQMQRAGAVGDLNAGLSFSILPLSHILFFAVLVTLAIANIQRPEWHKRLMLVATISALNAPIARFFIYFVDFHGHMPVPAGLLTPPPPIETPFEVEDYVVYLMLLIPCLYDWVRRGRPHPAYLCGGGALVLIDFLQAPISQTSMWRAIASGLLSLAS